MPAFRDHLGQRVTVSVSGGGRARPVVYSGHLRELSGHYGDPFGDVVEMSVALDRYPARPPSEETTMETRFHVHRKPKHDAAVRVASYTGTEVDYSAHEAAEKALRDQSIMFADGDLVVVTEDNGETVFVYGVKAPVVRLQLLGESDH